MLVILGIGFGIGFALLGWVFLAASKSDTLWGALTSAVIALVAACVSFFEVEWALSPRRLMVLAGVETMGADALTVAFIAVTLAVGMLWVLHRVGWVDALSRRFGSPTDADDEVRQ